MQRLCRITVPGLSIKSDFTAARQRLLADFANVHEVVATTAPGTIVIIYSGSDAADAWYDALADIVATSSVRGPGPLLPARARGLGGGDSAA